MRKGAQIGAVQDLLTPGRIALLAAGGAANVSVIPRPRVAVVMTGSELVTPDWQPGRGAIRDSNGPMLRALIEKARFTFAGSLPCPDDLEETCRVLEQASQRADLIVTSGGVSVGDFDFVPEAVRRLGGEILFHRISIKPGKPALAARLNDAWLVGLPGNPVSVLTCWRLFAQPLGLALAGDLSLLHEKPRRAPLTVKLENREERAVLHPATMQQDGERLRITPLPWKGSHDVAAAAQAEVLIRLEPGERVEADTEVKYYSLD
jgi:molybdopterin molybdotransferase